MIGTWIIPHPYFCQNMLNHNLRGISPHSTHTLSYCDHQKYFCTFFLLVLTFPTGNRFDKRNSFLDWHNFVMFMWSLIAIWRKKLVCDFYHVKNLIESLLEILSLKWNPGYRIVEFFEKIYIITNTSVWVALNIQLRSKSHRKLAFCEWR